MKVCSKCKIEKTLDCFNKNLKCKNGLNPSCKECIKKYREENKEKIKIRCKKYRQNNKEKIKEYELKRKATKKSAYLEYRKNYYEKNKEKIIENGKQWRLKNKEYKNKKAILYRKEKIKVDPIFKLKINLRSNLCQSFKRGKNQYKKNARTETILGCTMEDFILYIQSQFQKGMTLENHGEWHFDHIIPLASATTEDEIIKLNHYTNFQPLWAKENISKADKIMEKQIK
jgi:hypothetical protein